MSRWLTPLINIRKKEQMFGVRWRMASKYSESYYSNALGYLTKWSIFYDCGVKWTCTLWPHISTRRRIRCSNILGPFYLSLISPPRELELLSCKMTLGKELSMLISALSGFSSSEPTRQYNPYVLCSSVAKPPCRWQRRVFNSGAKLQKAHLATYLESHCPMGSI